MLGGCGKKEKNYDSLLSKDDPTTITIWHYYNGVQLISFDEAVEEFNNTVGLDKGIIVEAYSKNSVSELADSVVASVKKDSGTLYTMPPFKNSADVRTFLENRIQDTAQSAYDEAMDKISNGGDRDEVLATVYLRDINVTDGFATERKNVFLEAGSADIASEFDVMLDSDWTSHLQLSGGEKGSFEFYYKTLRTARENPKTDMADLGCWTGFSAISETGRESMRYTVPLVADSGEVYGVIGIGLMEKTVLSYIPGNDLPNERSCYILGVDMDNDGVYVPQPNSGAIYKRVVGSGTVISREHSIGKNVYDFNTNSTVSVPTVGTIKDVNIYNADSPYKYNRWAIISISEKAEALSIYSTLVHLFTVSFAISAAITLLCTIFMNRHLTAPVRKISRTLEQNRDSDEIINFESSGITEIDSLTDEIKQLQINVKEQSSRVSKIISMAVVGIGAFMYDTVKQTVFISESMISTLSCDKLPGGDRTIPYSEFSRLMAEIDYKNDTNIAKHFADVYSGEDGAIISRRYPLTTDEGDKKWFSLSLRRDGANILGLVQDVTQSVMEMQKVKYERDYDVTTGLLNRRAYQHTIEKMFREPKKLKTAAFLMFDIDDLKYVNDTYGHDLCAEAERERANGII